MRYQTRFAGILCGGILLTVLSSQAQVLYDTTVPNQFEFARTDIYVSQGATQAIVTVRFYPGNRSFSGSVGYSTRDGTAVANRDYVPVSGMLSFSGKTELTFTVPLLNPKNIEPKTIGLVLSYSQPVYPTNATVHIHMPPPPNLEIQRVDDTRVVLLWDNDGSETWVEKWEPGSSWTRLYPQAIYSSGGRLNVIDGAPSATSLYRLRREQ